MLQQRPICSGELSIFSSPAARLSSFFLSPAAGLGARIFGQLFEWLFMVARQQHEISKARGKGMAPEAGPRHGAAGLRVTPERAAQAAAAAAA